MARRGQKLATPRAVGGPRSIHQHGAGASPSVLGQVNCGQIRRRRPPCGPHQGPADSENRTRPLDNGAFLTPDGVLTRRDYDQAVDNFPMCTHPGYTPAP